MPRYGKLYLVRAGIPLENVFDKRAYFLERGLMAYLVREGIWLERVFGWMRYLVREGIWFERVFG